MNAPVRQHVELTKAQKVFTLVGSLLGLLLAALDQTIVTTAGPAIQHDLAIEASLYVWITTAYLVASTVLIPVYGKLSDIFGRKPILISGIVVFLVGSFLCGVAQTPLQLILFRAVQGAGSAALFTNAFAVVADIFPPAERGKFQGLFGAVFGLSSVVGPLAGGFITDNFGWHWTFFVNLPVGAVALGFVLARMPKLGGYATGARPSIDYAGAATLAVAVVPLLLALSFGKTTDAVGGTGWPWVSWQILGMFAVAIVGTLAFVMVEARAASPILDLKLFSNRAFTIGVAAAFVTGGAFLGAIVFLPLFMVNVVGLSATRTGLTTMPLTMGIVAGNILSGQIVARVGRYKPIILVSLVILVIGFAVMAFTLTETSSQAEVTLKMVLVGLGLGPSIPLFTLAVQNAVAPPQIGVATSSATFFRQMGQTIGVAVLGTVFASTLTNEIKTGVERATAGVPAEFRAQLPRPGTGGEGARSEVAFDAVAVKKTIDARIPGEAGRAQAYAVVDEVAAAFKTAFTNAIRRVYFLALFIGILGILVTLALPELPLRKTMGGPPPPVAD